MEKSQPLLSSFCVRGLDWDLFSLSVDCFLGEGVWSCTKSEYPRPGLREASRAGANVTGFSEILASTHHQVPIPPAGSMPASTVS